MLASRPPVAPRVAIRSSPWRVRRSEASPGDRAIGGTVKRPRAEPKPIDPDLGINNITHVIVVVQENRSFDHYFGTFPGADGIPRNANGQFTTCVPDPEAHQCWFPYHDTNEFDAGGPHGVLASRLDVNGGKMDGFVQSLEATGNTCTHHPGSFPCRQTQLGPAGQPDILGYHTAHEIPNYWAYAKHFVLQDHMYAPSDSWTVPSHLYLVSGWSATCPNLNDPMSCRSDVQFPGHNAAPPGHKMWIPEDGPPRPYVWADITWLLNEHNVSWAYYVGSATCLRPGCGPSPDQEDTAPVQNTLPGFKTVAVDHQLENVQSNANYFASAADGTLPSVSWVMPTENVSEHPPDNIADGESLVTKVVNAAMKGPDWLHTAIFITWDDWGRLLRPRRTAKGGRERVRDPGARAHDQPVGAPGVHRPPDALVRRLPEVHRGSVPGRGADRSEDRRVARLAADGPRERATARRSLHGVQLRPAAHRSTDP